MKVDESELKWMKISAMLDASLIQLSESLEILSQRLASAMLPRGKGPQPSSTRWAPIVLAFIGRICIWCIFCICIYIFLCQLKRNLIGGEQPAGPDDGEAGGLAGLHHRQHGEHDQQDHDDGGRKMFLKLAKECWNQPCLGEEGGGRRTVTQPGGQACGGHLQGGFFN